MPFFAYPAAVCAAAAIAVRLVVGHSGLERNPLLLNLTLDSKYYVEWAREIAGGDWTSAHGIVAGSPFILNPLYAYVIAPIAGLAADPVRPILLFQAFLAAATTALAAVAARRFFGLTAAWTAGLAVAFSTALVQLDTHVAVSGLAAFLTAGAVFASAPPRVGAPAGGHGAVAAGLWLGIGALARPITPIALPFFAWNLWKSATSRRFAGVAVLVAVFASCALPSLFRNWAVAGDPIVYTSASGLNLHIGNNPESRKFRTMVSPWTQFEPKEMHRDAWRYVVFKSGGDPTPSEVSSYFTRMAIDEFIRSPGASVVFYAQKARWFFAPVEVPSTASLANDLRFTPLLRLAFVPTWLLAAAGLVGAILHRRRRDVICGPGALVFAHIVVLTLVFPISHYRSPAIAALAVLAGGAVAAAVDAWRSGARRTMWWIAAAVAATALAGACPPQPDRCKHADAMLLAFDSRERGRYDEAVAYVYEAMGEFRAISPESPEFVPGLRFLGELEGRRGNYPAALVALGRVLTRQPDDWPARLLRSKVAQDAGDYGLAQSDARWVVEHFPELPQGRKRLEELQQRRR